MASENQTPVLIIGAGPVGLTLAAELASRSIDSIIIEIRRPAEAPNVRCNHVAARSMEIFRRLGIADALRNAGLPPDYPNDVSYRTTTVGQEITRIPIPCRRDRFTDKSGPDGDWQTPEPPHRINQLYLEPILFKHVNALDRVQILNRHAFESVQQDKNGVSATIRDLETNITKTIHAQFLVGCDGGKSVVRKAIGVQFTGDAVVQRVQSTWIEAPDLIEQMSAPPAWAMFSMNPRRSGNMYAIDGKRSWLIHNYLREYEPDFDSVDRDWAIRNILGVDDNFEYRVISKEDWVGRRLIAKRFRDRRIFLAGDAAHIWVPYGGYGMNAGIADASNLGWTLAAYLNSWGAPGILNAYESERMAITEQVSRFAMDHSAKMAARRRQVPEDIESNDASAIATRKAFGRDVYDLNVQQYCCAGLNFGYYYEQSPIIIGDGTAPPSYSMGTYTESTVPGCRLPHRWLADGGSLYDRLGTGYTLIVTRDIQTFEPLADLAADLGIPFNVIDLSSEVADERLDFAALIVRTDQHVAWRSNAMPENPNQLLKTLNGELTEVAWQ